MGTPVEFCGCCGTVVAAECSKAGPAHALLLRTGVAIGGACSSMGLGSVPWLSLCKSTVLGLKSTARIASPRMRVASSSAASLVGPCIASLSSSGSGWVAGKGSRGSLKGTPAASSCRFSRSRLISISTSSQKLS